MRVAGLAAAWSVPAGLAVSLLVRALWRGWRPLAIAPADASDPVAVSEAGARVAGALGFGLFAVLLVAAAGWAGATTAASLTHVPRLVGLTVGLFAVAAAALGALLSLPVGRALAALVLAVDRRRERTRGRRVVTPARVLAVGAALAALAVLALWLGLLVRPAHARGALYLTTFALALAGAHAALARLGRRERRVR